MPQKFRCRKCYALLEHKPKFGLCRKCKIKQFSPKRVCKGCNAILSRRKNGKGYCPKCRGKFLLAKNKPIKGCPSRTLCKQCGKAIDINNKLGLCLECKMKRVSPDRFCKICGKKLFRKSRTGFCLKCKGKIASPALKKKIENITHTPEKAEEPNIHLKSCWCNTPESCINSESFRRAYCKLEKIKNFQGKK